MMDNRATCRAIFALAAVALIATGCGGGGVGGKDIVVEGPITLTRTFDEGEVINYKFKIDTTSGVKRTAYEQSITSQTELKTTNTFTSVSDDKVEMTMRFDYAAGSVSMSDNVTSDQSVASLMGKELFFVLTPEGEVDSWTGLAGEEYLEAGAGQIAMLLFDVFPPLPDEPVVVGTTWSVDYDIPDISSAIDRDFIGEVNYTVTGFREKFDVPCVELAVVTDFEFEGRAEQGGEVWLMSGAGVTEGKMLLALEDARVVYSTAETMFTLTGEGSSVAGAAASNVVEMGIKSRLVIDQQW